MNFCFEKFVDLKAIISEGLDRLVAFKNSVLFVSPSKLLKRMYNYLFSSFIKLYEYWGNFQSSYKTKKSSMEKITRLILEKVIMCDRHMSDEQMYLFLKPFFNIEKIRLN